MTLLESIQRVSSAPIESIGSIKNLTSNDISASKSIGMRFLYVAQVLMSIVALPFILLFGLIEAGFRLFKGEGAEAMSNLGNALKYHLILAIPGSIIGAIAPFDLSKKCLETLSDCFLENATDPDALVKKEKQLIFPEKQTNMFHIAGIEMTTCNFT